MKCLNDHIHLESHRNEILVDIGLYTTFCHRFPPTSPSYGVTIKQTKSKKMKVKVTVYFLTTPFKEQEASGQYRASVLKWGVWTPFFSTSYKRSQSIHFLSRIFESFCSGRQSNPHLFCTTI